MITLRDAERKLTDTVLFSIPSPGGRKDGLLDISTGGGNAWPQSKEMIAGNFAYCALIHLDADTVGLLYETDHHRTVNFVRLDLD